MTPLDNVFNAVENLMDFAVAAGIPYINKQVVTFAYMILLKTGKFGSYIRDWNKKPFNNQTWMNFKSHFCNGLNELSFYQTIHLLYLRYVWPNMPPYIKTMIKKNTQIAIW